jgi:uncharacterized membrane protein
MNTDNGSILFRPIQPRSLFAKIITHIRKKLFAGLITVTPIAVTVVISMWLFRLITGSQWLKNAARRMPIDSDAAATTLALLLTLLIVYLIGLLSTTLLVRQVLRFTEATVARIPIVKVIYATVKQITDSLNRPAVTQGRKVVIVEYPRLGCFGVGFSTGETLINGVLHVRVFLPTTPNPTSGWLVIYRADEVWESSYTPEEGMKLILSGGIVGKPSLDLRPYQPAGSDPDDASAVSGANEE